MHGGLSSHFEHPEGLVGHWAKRQGWTCVPRRSQVQLAADPRTADNLRVARVMNCAFLPQHSERLPSVLERQTPFSGTVCDLSAVPSPPVIAQASDLPLPLPPPTERVPLRAGQGPSPAASSVNARASARPLSESLTAAQRTAEAGIIR